MTQPDGGNTDPANSGQQVTMFTQDQVNHYNAEAKRGAVTSLFKDAGFEKPLTPQELKDLAANAGEFQKLKDGEKGDVERLNGQLAAANEKASKVPTLEAMLSKATLAADAGLKSRYWKYVEGDDEEAIKASIAEVLKDIKGAGDDDGDDSDDDSDDSGAGGGTTKLTPNPHQGGSGGGNPKPKSMKAGADAYAAKHKRE